MIRKFTVLATLVATVAIAGAASAEEVRMNLSGKTTAQAYAAIESAAKRVCMPAADSVYSVYLASPCVSETIAATLAKIGDPALLRYSQARNAVLVASN